MQDSISSLWAIYMWFLAFDLANKNSQAFAHCQTGVDGTNLFLIDLVKARLNNI